MHHKSLEEYYVGEQKRIGLLKGSNLSPVLVIKDLFLSTQVHGEKNYSVTKKVDSLQVDEYGVMGDRHRKDSHFRPVLREKYIYPKGTLIKSERHILAISEGMCKAISDKMGTQVTPELLGVNILLGREDGQDFYFDGLPLGTDFMIFSHDAVDTQDKTKFIANLKFIIFQMGCGVTGVSIADSYSDPTQTMNFVKNSQEFRGILLCLHGPQTSITLERGQKVFIGIPTGYIH